MAERDRWADWLLERRFGGTESTPEERAKWMEPLWKVRDRVLDRAGLDDASALLDVGCGDGLIGFGALERGVATVTLSDVSEELLDVCRAAAKELGVADRCRFVAAGAEDLAGIDDGSVDVVTTRSVLIYVEGKARSFREFHRVLRPGGRISLYEPINRFGIGPETPERFWMYPSDGLNDLARKIYELYKAIQPESDPMLDFDERDLIALAEEAGFFPIDLELHAEVKPPEPVRWEVFAHSSGNPKIPTWEEAMEQVLTPEERERVVAHLRPLVEEGRGVRRIAHAYVSATKPG
ncbi:MAG TPA: class I SAM-dependent methyltransferase [Gaiellaceae bacterium]